jgi:hypothetical protein
MHLVSNWEVEMRHRKPSHSYVDLLHLLTNSNCSFMYMIIHFAFVVIGPSQINWNTVQIESRWDTKDKMEYKRRHTIYSTRITG